MAQADSSFLIPLLAGEAPRPLLDIVNAFHAAEAHADGDHVQKIPYYRWHGALDGAQKGQLQQAVKAQWNADPENAEGLVLAAGLMMRVRAEEPALLKILKKSRDSVIPKLENPAALYELGNILRALPDWPHLQALSAQALDRPQAQVWRAHIFADWHILARYRQLVKRFETNSVTADDLEAFAGTIEWLAGRIGEDTKNIAFYRSLMATLRKELDTAIDWTLKAQTLAGKTIALFQRLESFVAPGSLTDTEQPGHSALAAAVEHQFRHAPDGEPALLLSADESYFNQFADKLFESFAHWNPGGVIHIHCVHFSLNEDRLAALEATHGIRINASIDCQPAIERGTDLFPGYCANARYLFLPHYLEHYRRIAVSDIDGVIRRPLAELWPEGSDAIRMTTKILSRKWSAARLLWETIAAGSLAISDTPANRRFAWMVANYLADQVEVCRRRSMKLFYTDQIGLLLAFMACRGSCDFKPLSGLYRQRGLWQFSGAADERARQQQLIDFKTRDS